MQKYKHVWGLNAQNMILLSSIHECNDSATQNFSTSAEGVFIILNNNCSLPLGSDCCHQHGKTTFGNAVVRTLQITLNFQFWINYSDRISPIYGCQLAVQSLSTNKNLQMQLIFVSNAHPGMACMSSKALKYLSYNITGLPHQYCPILVYHNNLQIIWMTSNFMRVFQCRDILTLLAI